ncbi:MAG: hypothetical protein KF752_19340 [Pirellulaceae bacterium]|nr:hypothetical protein [Pirellulaceae bacterium]
MLNFRWTLGLGIGLSGLLWNAVCNRTFAQSVQNAATEQGRLVATEAADDTWLKHLTFCASFDHGIDADYSLGDKRIHTAEDLNRKRSTPGNLIAEVNVIPNSGRHGGALSFTKKTRQSLFYWATAIGYRSQDWSGSLSVWMKLDPNKDLRPGYCDPVLLTDKQWDQSALFVDFDKDLPRDFRLGVFPDYQVWNPSAMPWEKIPVAERPMVVVKQPPFSAEQWTHVCFTWQNANLADDGPGVAKLYLNGQLHGSHQRVLRYTWQPDQAAIMLGIHYIGLMDELATFDQALTDGQVAALYNLPSGLTAHLPTGQTQ